MLFHGRRSLPYRFQLLLASLQLSHSLPFTDVLSQEQIQDVADRHEVSYGNEDEAVYTPAITLWGFLSQVIHKGEQRSCLAAVARIGMLLVSLGRPRCAQNNGPYCRARGCLPVAVVQELTTHVAEKAEAAVPDKWLWNGRHVKLVDGTTITMPDTEANQAVYPQQTVQKEGLGFPIARLVAILSLGTAMIHQLAMAPFSGKGTGETSLLRQLMGTFQAGEIALLDKLFANFWTLADFMHRGVDVVTLLNETRHMDLSQATRLGAHDYLIRIDRPKRPSWMDEETYEQLPQTLELRLIQCQVRQPGFRPSSLRIVTTLVNSNVYSTEEVARLYSKRWHVELDIRAIKVSMGMTELRCKSPEMVHKEIWTCLLAYNLIRLKLLQAAMQKGTHPLTMSFTNGLQMMAAGWLIGPILDPHTLRAIVESALIGLGDQKVGHRAGRVEPRAVKRRPKPTPLLTMPRDEARRLLLSGTDPYQKQK